jgi:hypothetical protein
MPLAAGMGASGGVVLRKSQSTELSLVFGVFGGVAAGVGDGAGEEPAG